LNYERIFIENSFILIFIIEDTNSIQISTST
jgi:hypothetical protein